jgi:integrase
MVAVADRHRFGPFYVLAGATGLVPGELCALRWADVHFDEERPYLVAAGAVRRAQHGYVIGAAKTPGSRRALPLPPVAVDALRLSSTRKPEHAPSLATRGPRRAWSSRRRLAGCSTPLCRRSSSLPCVSLPTCHTAACTCFAVR